MTVKRDSIVDSIRRLPPGSKVSVRGLAEVLGVSVGTAHKAVRLAEELGLVQVVPRSGTFRSDDACRETGPEGLLLSNVIERLGLTVLCGARYANVPIGEMCIRDRDNPGGRKRGAVFGVADGLARQAAVSRGGQAGDIAACGRCRREYHCYERNSGEHRPAGDGHGKGLMCFVLGAGQPDGLWTAVLGAGQERGLRPGGQRAELDADAALCVL